MQTPWQQQDLSFPEGPPFRGHAFQDNNHKKPFRPRPSMRPITEGNFSISANIEVALDRLVVQFFYFGCFGDGGFGDINLISVDA